MALINHRAREIHFKIVYYGPGLGGKTTNLRVIHARLPAERRGRLLSIATDHERTLFFDFLPVDLGQINGFATRFHLYTVPGQVYYKRSRRAVLQGTDGVVFVADSHPAREHANCDSLADLEEQLATLGMSAAELARLPRVVQYNKRDVPGALAVERLRGALNPRGALEFEAVASQGRGVSETLRAICKGVLARLAPPAPAATPRAAALAAGGATAAGAATVAGAAGAGTIARAVARPSPARPA